MRTSRRSAFVCSKGLFAVPDALGGRAQVLECIGDDGTLSRKALDDALPLAGRYRVGAGSGLKFGHCQGRPRGDRRQVSVGAPNGFEGSQGRLAGIALSGDDPALRGAARVVVFAAKTAQQLVADPRYGLRVPHRQVNLAQAVERARTILGVDAVDLGQILEPVRCLIAAAESKGRFVAEGLGARRHRRITRRPLR